MEFLFFFYQYPQVRHFWDMLFSFFVDRSDWMCKLLFWYGLTGKCSSVAFIIIVTLQRYNFHLGNVHIYNSFIAMTTLSLQLSHEFGLLLTWEITHSSFP